MEFHGTKIPRLLYPTRGSHWCGLPGKGMTVGWWLFAAEAVTKGCLGEATCPVLGTILHGRGSGQKAISGTLWGPFPSDPRRKRGHAHQVLSSGTSTQQALEKSQLPWLVSILRQTTGQGSQFRASSSKCPAFLHLHYWTGHHLPCQLSHLFCDKIYKT